MKKIIAVVIAVLLLTLPMSLSAFAAGEINESEKNILDELYEKVAINGKKFIVPTEYVVQAENYFKTVDIDPTQAAEIITYIDQGKEILINSDIKSTTDLKVLPVPDKQKILDLGKKAVAVTGGTLVYDGSHVKITNSQAQLVFDSAPIIKQTGVEADFTAVIIAASAVAVLFGAAVVVAKKRGLFAK